MVTTRSCVVSPSINWNRMLPRRAPTEVSMRLVASTARSQALVRYSVRAARISSRFLSSRAMSAHDLFGLVIAVVTGLADRQLVDCSGEQNVPAAAFEVGVAYS